LIAIEPGPDCPIGWRDDRSKDWIAAAEDEAAANVFCVGGIDCFAITAAGPSAGGRVKAGAQAPKNFVIHVLPILWLPKFIPLNQPQSDLAGTNH
jgi:hypothetical protein